MMHLGKHSAVFLHTFCQHLAVLWIKYFAIKKWIKIWKQSCAFITYSNKRVHVDVLLSKYCTWSRGALALPKLLPQSNLLLSTVPSTEMIGEFLLTQITTICHYAAAGIIPCTRQQLQKACRNFVGMGLVKLQSAVILIELTIYVCKSITFFTNYSSKDQLHAFWFTILTFRIFNLINLR